MANFKNNESNASMQLKVNMDDDADKSDVPCLDMEPLPDQPMNEEQQLTENNFHMIEQRVEKCDFNFYLRDNIITE